ncbi:hypothetical protein [Lutibacter sp.]
MSDIKKYRVDFEPEELAILQELINRVEDKNYTTFNEMKDKINNPKEILWSAKKSIAADNATKARTSKAKKKIQNAINILRMENKKITHYSIAKTAGVSYLTVKKYISLNDIN